MKGDHISRKYLKEQISELRSHDDSIDIWIKRFDVEDLIENAPSVEPEKSLVANVTFDENKLKEIVQTEVIDKINSGELLLKAEEPQDDIIPMEFVAGKCPIEVGGNCPLKPQGDLISRSEFSNAFNNAVYAKLHNEYLKSTANQELKDVAEFVTTDIMIIFNNLIEKGGEKNGQP